VTPRSDKRLARSSYLQCFMRGVEAGVEKVEHSISEDQITVTGVGVLCPRTRTKQVELSHDRH
jgi:hypothetical protein